MGRRPLTLFLLAAALSGCADMGGISDAPLPLAATPAGALATPAEDYDAGALLHARGDDAGARAHWMRCVETSAPDSRERLNCMVALESLAAPSGASAR
jgi:hypothetical protein